MLTLLDSLHERIRFSMARLAQSDEVTQPIRFAVISEPPKRLDVVYVVTCRSAVVAKPFIARLCFALLRGPIRPPVVRHTFANMLRMQRPDALGVSAGAGTKTSAGFTAWADERSAAALANVRYEGGGFSSAVLAGRRAMFAATVLGARWLYRKFLAAMGALDRNGAKHGETMG